MIWRIVCQYTFLTMFTFKESREQALLQYSSNEVQSYWTCTCINTFSIFNSNCKRWSHHHWHTFWSFYPSFYNCLFKYTVTTLKSALKRTRWVVYCNPSVHCRLQQCSTRLIGKFISLQLCFLSMCWDKIKVLWFLPVQQLSINLNIVGLCSALSLMFAYTFWFEI